MAKATKTLNENTPDPFEEAPPADDPIGASVPPEPVETIEDQGIGATDPYPTGSPPDPAEEFRKIHGFDKPTE